MQIRLVKLLILSFVGLLPQIGWSQTLTEKLTAAFNTFTADAQMRNGLASLLVINATTGQVVFGKNELIGLAPASTQKIIISVSAYELLGKEFTYKTNFAFSTNQAEASLLISPGGDPTLGSWRWPTTRENRVIKNLTLALKKAGIKNVREVVIDNSGWEGESVPDGWMWQDIGNYYGAGAGKFNWRENQFDVLLKSGKAIGSAVTVVGTNPALSDYSLNSQVKAAAAGTGDNAYIYFPLQRSAGVIRGTIPVNENRFKISGALPNPTGQFLSTLADTLVKVNIKIPKKFIEPEKGQPLTGRYGVFYTIQSPPLDSLIFWFNRKSINLYGEALVKTIAYKKTGQATTGKGLDLIRTFWKQQGLPESELNLVDGSGLSPLNRVTTHAQVQVLQHARKQPWFNEFYTALPRYNGMKMKSGTIRGVKGYCGYHRSKDGQEYIFAFLVNNYHGSAPALVQKMYTVLDALK